MVSDPLPASVESPDPQVYCGFDFRLISEIPLNGLAVAAPGDLRPLVEVRIERLPKHLAGGGRSQPAFQATNDEALLTVPSVGRFLIRDGREILIEPAPGASQRNLRLFLLGSALGILSHQRGLLPLHANAIIFRESAYAFCGHSGAGKSTLAAHFQRAGYEVLCDDVCPVALDERERPIAWPGIPRLKLWSDAARVLGHDPATLERVAEGLEKYHVPVAARPDPSPLPLRRLYVLSQTEEGGSGRIVRLAGKDAMATVLAHTYRGMHLGPMGLRARHFLQCATLLRTLRVYAAPRAWGFDVFNREAERLEWHMLREDEE